MGKMGERVTLRKVQKITIKYIVQLHERVVIVLQLNEAVSKRVSQLLQERNMTQYQLFKRTGVPRATISSIVKCEYPSVKLRIIHEMCQGFGIGIADFFHSPLFNEDNLEP